MSWIIIASIICTVFSLILIFVGVVLDDDEDGMIGFGIILLIISVLFGWGVLALVAPIDYKESIIVPTEMANTKYTVFVKIEGQTLTTTDAKFVNATEGSLRVKKTVGINSYGREQVPSYELFVEEK